MPHPLSIRTKGQARCFFESVTLAEWFQPLLGRLVSTSFDQLTNGPHEVFGWAMNWHYVKPDRCGKGGEFEYSISAFVPYGQRRARAAGVVLDAFRRFLDHELREALFFDGVRVFDPHRLDDVMEKPQA